MPCGHGHTEKAVAGSGRLVFLAAELLAMHEICIFYTHNSMRLRVWLQLQFGSGFCHKYFGIECSILFWATTGCVPVCVCVTQCHVAAIQLNSLLPLLLLLEPPHKANASRGLVPLPAPPSGSRFRLGYRRVSAEAATQILLQTD